MTNKEDRDIWNEENDLNYEKGEGINLTDGIILIIIFFILFGVGFGLLIMRARHLKIPNRPNQLDAIVVGSAAFMAVSVLAFVYNGVLKMYRTQNSKMDKLAEFVDKWNEEEKEENGEWVWIENEDGTGSYYWVRKGDKPIDEPIKQPVHNPCEPNPCLNNGTCEVDGDTFKCICDDNNYGEKCSETNEMCEPNGEGTTTCGLKGNCVIQPNNEFMCECKDTWDETKFEWISDGNNYCNILKDKTNNENVIGTEKCENKLFINECNIQNTPNIVNACVTEDLCPAPDGFECEIYNTAHYTSLDIKDAADWKDKCPLYYKHENYCKEIDDSIIGTKYNNYYDSNSCKLFRKECEYATTNEECNSINTYDGTTNRCVWDGNKNQCNFNNNITV